MHISDDNTLEDIQGTIFCLQTDVEKEAPEFPVGPRFKKLLARIDDQLLRNNNKIHRNGLQMARDHAVEAERAFMEKRTRDAYESLQKCWDYLEQGNKAHRRKPAFVALPDGQISTVAPKSGEQGGST